MITLSLDGCKCTQHVINIKIVSVCTMINPKSMLWQLTIFSWATYNQFFFGFFRQRLNYGSFSQATVTIYDLLVHLIKYNFQCLFYCYGSELGENIEQAMI